MFIKTSIAAALLVAAATPAFAGPASRTIGYGDLSLSGPAGAARFQARIDRAIRVLCGTAHPTDLNDLADVRRCRADLETGIAARRAAILAAANAPRTGDLAAAGTR
jgi:UrcA family protein